ncbi:GIY-YIG nuclease family protein [Paracoccus sp. Z118]|uniref:GIY-YIG nuclease family protein n=1 Tax=Paracoccus sp. Z118 TaxID=2851017 RepID=UPI001C2BE963|nr:GIY-YIG nuclease family protein [Paracoccus sp. Z118]MBV0893501.1 GIY-YIG nuclease family protein [Paracoccus sp. Z118]
MSHLDLDAVFSAADHSHPIYHAAIPDAWQDIAQEKGYEIVGRVIDRFHLVLRHEDCGAEMVSKVFTLRTAEPVCPTCLDTRRRELCAAAGVSYLGRGGHPNYFRILLPCGHETVRQQELLERVRQGKTAIRCDACLGERLKDEARARGWELIGADPEDDPSYRHYRHDCGHVQRVAVANMTTGRFTCGGCSDGWTRDKSFLYAMRFVLKTGRDVIKVGFSRDPESRLRHQLITDRDQYARLIRTVAVPSGREAIRREKELHTTLGRRYPDAVLHRSEFADEVKVVSEIYCASIEPEIMRLLDEVEMQVKALCRRRAKLARRAERRLARRRRHGRRARRAL